MLDKPFSILETWKVLLILFFIAVVAGFILHHLHFIRLNIIMSEDGRCGVIEPSFIHPLKRKDCDKYGKEWEGKDWKPLAASTAPTAETK